MCRGEAILWSVSVSVRGLRAGGGGVLPALRVSIGRQRATQTERTRVWTFDRPARSSREDPALIEHMFASR